MPLDTMRATDKEVIAGQAVYSKRVLNLYDFIVLGVSNKFIWKCPTKHLVEFYTDNISANHLDVGVGTGYFMQHTRFPSDNPRVALMDLNQNTLDYASSRNAKLTPEIYRRNVLEPIEFSGEKFDSIGVNYLLHCLPGSMESKSILFDHLLPLMNPGAVIFGSTLLHDGVERSWAAKRLMNFYNKKGVFSNTEDSLELLKKVLNQRFKEVTVEVRGCVALFSVKV